jgi:type I restriction enzyme R subunit
MRRRRQRHREELARRKARKQLDDAREALRYLCEPVAQPREVEQYLHYFCGDAAIPKR